MAITWQHCMSCFPVAMIKGFILAAGYRESVLVGGGGSRSSKRQAWWLELAAERSHLQSQTGSEEGNMEAEQG